MSRVLHVDLTGSNCGPVFRSVDVRGDWPDEWSDDRLRHECAAYYEVPPQQVEIRSRGKDARP